MRSARGGFTRRPRPRRRRGMAEPRPLRRIRIVSIRVGGRGCLVPLYKSMCRYSLISRVVKCSINEISKVYGALGVNRGYMVQLKRSQSQSKKIYLKSIVFHPLMLLLCPHRIAIQLSTKTNAKKPKQNVIINKLWRFKLCTRSSVVVPGNATALPRTWMGNMKPKTQKQKQEREKCQDEPRLM